MKHVIGIIAMLFAACSTGSVKDNINRAGDAAGQAAGEFLEGATKGVEKAFDVKLMVDDALAARGIQLGKCTVSNDTNGTDNLLTVYIVFNQDFKDTLLVRAFDGDLEAGRAQAVVGGRRNESAFVDFRFDPRVNLDSKNTLRLE